MASLMDLRLSTIPIRFRVSISLNNYQVEYLSLGSDNQSLI